MIAEKKDSKRNSKTLSLLRLLSLFLHQSLCSLHAVFFILLKPIKFYLTNGINFVEDNNMKAR